MKTKFACSLFAMLYLSSGWKFSSPQYEFFIPETINWRSLDSSETFLDSFLSSLIVADFSIVIVDSELKNLHITFSTHCLLENDSISAYKEYPTAYSCRLNKKNEIGNKRAQLQKQFTYIEGVNYYYIDSLFINRSENVIMLNGATYRKTEMLTEASINYILKFISN